MPSCDRCDHETSTLLNAEHLNGRGITRNYVRRATCMPFLVDGQNRFFAPRGKIDFRDPFRFHAFLLQKRTQKWARKSKLGFKHRFLFLLFFHIVGFSSPFSTRGTPTMPCVGKRTPLANNAMAISDAGHPQLDFKHPLSVRVGTSQYDAVRVSTSQYESVQVSTSQYKSVQVSTCQHPSVQVSTSQHPSVRVSASQHPSVRVSTSQYDSVRVRTGQY